MSFKRDYNESINGLYDKQFGNSNTLDESAIEKAISSSKQTLRSIISLRKEVFSSISLDSRTNNLFDIVLSSNDPDTGEPFTEEKVNSKNSFKFSIFVIDKKICFIKLDYKHS